MVGYCTDSNQFSDSVQRKAVGKSLDELKICQLLKNNCPSRYGSVFIFFIEIETFGSKKQLECKARVNKFSSGNFVSKVSLQCYLFSVTSGHLQPVRACVRVQGK